MAARRVGASVSWEEDAWPEREGLVSVDRAGFGCVWTAWEVLDILNDPWFLEDPAGEDVKFVTGR